MANTWQEELRAAATSVLALEGYAFLRDQGSLGEVEGRFRTLVPPYYLGLIDKNDPEDPIARMAFPAKEEARAPKAGLRDPIGDLAKAGAPRLTHRYPDRALLHVTNLCPMYCRFCFRKNLMNEKDDGLYGGEFTAAWAYLARHPEITEVIFTGGDPWMLSDERLRALVSALGEASPGLQRLRFHSRMPVTLPQRVTDGLLDAIVRPGRWQTYVVTHFNHPRELSPLARQALQRLRGAGVVVLNQTVLLRGVNDQADCLRALFLGLGQEGVLPYYLHHCDLVEGAEHFRLPLRQGLQLWEELRGITPGYLIPEYVLDIPGGGGKVPVASRWVQEVAPGRFLVGKNLQEYQDPTD